MRADRGRLESKCRPARGAHAVAPRQIGTARPETSCSSFLISAPSMGSTLRRFLSRSARSASRATNSDLVTQSMRRNSSTRSVSSISALLPAGGTAGYPVAAPMKQRLRHVLLGLDDSVGRGADEQGVIDDAGAVLIGPRWHLGDRTVLAPLGASAGGETRSTPRGRARAAATEARPRMRPSPTAGSQPSPTRVPGRGATARGRSARGRSPDRDRSRTGCRAGT